MGDFSWWILRHLPSDNLLVGFICRALDVPPKFFWTKSQVQLFDNRVGNVSQNLHCYRDAKFHLSTGWETIYYSPFFALIKKILLLHFQKDVKVQNNKVTEEAENAE